MGFKKAVLLLGGDLYNSLTGYTSKGTQLNNEVGRDTQFEAVMNAVLRLTNHLLSIFPQVEVYFVRGNHGGTTDIPLAWALKNYYREEKRLSFDISSCRTMPIRVVNTLILLDHGASDEVKALIPTSGAPREAYVANLFLANPELLIGIKNKLLIQGDLHHFHHQEFAEFDTIQCGALPAGSQYSSAKGLRGHSSQQCFVIGPRGLETTHHFDLTNE